MDKGWIRAVVRVTDAKDSGFMPSIYGVNVERVLNGPKVDDIVRVVSYVEEFRLQAQEGEVCLVVGTLEKVEGLSKSFHQITLTRKPRYHEQMLKVHSSTLLGALTNYVTLLALTYLGLHYLMVNLIGILLGFMVNYLFSEMYVWKAPT